MNVRLRLHGITKSFGGTPALRGVDLSAAPGEIHALIGENGAGKSTLMKILSGALRPDAGTLELDGHPFRPDSPRAAREAGVAMIYQELTLAPHLTVQENILLGQEPRRLGWIRSRMARETARQALAAIDRPDLPLDIPVANLPLATRQMVEIARSMVRLPRVLILDEPTGVLGREDVQRLFETLHRLRDRGVTILYISHFLEEIRRLAQTCTVLRDGSSVASGPLDALSNADLVRHMAGREVAELYPRIPHTHGPIVLQVDGLSGPSAPRGVSFELRQGEILGLFGLVGSGRTETLRQIFRLDPPAGGTVVLDGHPLPPGGPRARWRQSLGMVVEDRKQEGLLLGRTLRENITLPTLHPYSVGGFVRIGRETTAARRWLDHLHVRCLGPEQPVGELSGGNQQKVAVARLLHHDSRILLLDEPTRGIDVATKAALYRTIGELAASGKSILMVSSYLPELLGVCDTLAVFARGRLRALRPVSDWTPDDILAHATDL
jgi:ribose transport system ATP-binding protein